MEYFRRTEKHLEIINFTEFLTSDIFASLSEENFAGFISGFASNKNEIEIDEPYISKEFSSAQKFVEIYNRIEALEKSNGFKENKYNRRMAFEFSEDMKNWISVISFQFNSLIIIFFKKG